ncbi:hypothetical protein NJ7G_0525 [Natrinema sp. J7-2]|nr:hypothetical protein NJ7G_0525 [Natrinema sp. J7-2]
MRGAGASKGDGFADRPAPRALPSWARSAIGRSCSSTAPAVPALPTPFASTRRCSYCCRWPPSSEARSSEASAADSPK